MNLRDPKSGFFVRLLSLIIEVILYGAIVALGFTLLNALGIAFFEVESTEEPFKALAAEYVPSIILFSLAMLVCNNVIFKRPLSVTGYVKKGCLRDTSDGYLLAFCLIGIGFIILKFGGFLSMEGVEFDGLMFFGFLLMFFVQSASEEVLSRSWMIPAIESRFGPWVALIISSSIFSVGHFGNPNVNWIGLINILLAGLMLGLFFLKYRNIWFVTGLHAGWNWVQATVFDFNVSGFDVYSLINFNPYGNEMISGGKFGFEGSIVSCIMLTLVIGYLLWKHYDDMFKNRPVFYTSNDVEVEQGGEE